MQLTDTQDQSEYVTVSEAAHLSGLSTDTIRRYADKGLIPVFRTPANHRRFRRTDALSLVKETRAA